MPRHNLLKLLICLSHQQSVLHLFFPHIDKFTLQIYPPVGILTKNQKIKVCLLSGVLRWRCLGDMARGQDRADQRSEFPLMKNSHHLLPPEGLQAHAALCSHMCIPTWPCYIIQNISTYCVFFISFPVCICTNLLTLCT